MTTNAPPPLLPSDPGATNGLRALDARPEWGILWDSVWTWVVVGLATVLILGLLALAFWLWRRSRKRRQQAPALRERVAPPHERAFRALEFVLQHLSDPDRFCTEVSRILRVYLEERFGWNAPDRTTEEFLADLRGHRELSAEQQGLLEDFLTRCDLVKFARHDPTETELRALHGAAVRLVTDTAPQSLPPTSEARTARAPGPSVPQP